MKTSLTVLIVCYKETDLLKRAYTSVINQTFQNFDIVLINDCSPNQETNRICLDLAQNPKVNYHRNKKNMGLSGSRNIGFELAKEGLVLPLDADDTLPPNTIELVNNVFKRYPEIDFIYGNYKVIYESLSGIDTVSTLHYVDNLNGLDPYELGKKWQLIGTSPCTKNLWRKIGGFDPYFSNSIQDQDFWQRAIMCGAKSKHIDEVIYRWHKYPNTMSSNTPFKDYYYIKRKNKEFHNRYTPIIRKYGYFTVMSYLFVKMKWKQLKSRLVK